MHKYDINIKVFMDPKCELNTILGCDRATRNSRNLCLNLLLLARKLYGMRSPACSCEYIGNMVLTIDSIVSQLPLVAPGTDAPNWDDYCAMRCFYGNALKVLTRSRALALVGKQVYGISGQPVYNAEDRCRAIRKFVIADVTDTKVMLIENGEKQWDVLHDGTVEPWVYFRNGEAVTGTGADRVYVFID